MEETETIVADYWEGVLEETRWELGEQRRRTAAAAAAAATAVVAEEGAAVIRKSKAAKRKQQKRKAQQQKKAAEMAEGRAVEAAMRGEADAKGDNEDGRQSPQEEQEKEQEEQEEEKKEGVVKGGSEQAVAAAAAALAAMTRRLARRRGNSVCLNTIKSDNAEKLAGPPLVCGHRYHAFCLHFWVERCESKCIESTCPYCRAPLQEMGSMQGKSL